MTFAVTVAFDLVETDCVDDVAIVVEGTRHAVIAQAGDALPRGFRVHHCTYIYYKHVVAYSVPIVEGLRQDRVLYLAGGIVSTMIYRRFRGTFANIISFMLG